MSFVAVAIGAAGAIAGAAISSSAAQGAAQTQANAAMRSQDIQQGMFNQIQGNEQPYMNLGAGAAGQLNYLLGQGQQGAYNQAGIGDTAASSSAGGYGSLNSPFTAQNFKQLSPAYQFQLQQGGQGTLNQDASSQGAESGAALKDLTSFNQQYANTSFNNAFNQYQAQQNNVFNRLSTLATLGSNAGSNSATGASQFGNSIGNSAQNVGTSLAAGQVGAANAWSGGLQSAGNWLAGSQAANSGQNPYSYQNQAGQNVYSGVTQNGGLGGGIGNIVDPMP